MHPWRRWLVPLLTGLLVAGGIAAMTLWQYWHAPPPLRLEPLTANQDSPAEAVPASSAVAASTVIMVDVSGAVVRPGVYTLAPSDRIEKAIQAAGGMTEEADIDSLPFSRAAIAVDEQRIFVPKIGEIVDSPTSEEPTLSVAAPIVPSCISINEASAETLDTLKGIGPVRATAILEGRPFAALDELVGRSVIPASVYEDIQSEICL